MIVKMLVHSPAGHGKTSLLGTACDDERLSPMLLLNFEGGTMSIQSRIREIGINDIGTVEPLLDKIDVVRITSWDDLEKAYNLVLRGVGYKSLAVDSLSELNYLCLTTIQSTTSKTDPSHDPDIPEMRDYQRLAIQMRQMIRFFRDLPMHVFFTSICQDVLDSSSGKMKTIPSLTGKLSAEVVGLLDIVAYLAVVSEGETTWRTLLCQPTGTFVAKDRSEGGKLGPKIDNPTLPRILDLLDA